MPNPSMAAKVLRAKRQRRDAIASLRDQELYASIHRVGRETIGSSDGVIVTTGKAPRIALPNRRTYGDGTRRWAHEGGLALVSWDDYGSQRLIPAKVMI